jgi:hypothetical protein
MAVLVASFAVTSDGSPYWWLLAAPLAVLGIAGLSQDAVRRKRDDHGRPVRGGPEHDA